MVGAVMSVLTLQDPAFLGSPGRLWTFADTPTAWWGNGGDASTVTSSGGVASQWNDKKDNGINLLATGTARPEYVLAELNGKNVLRFNGTTNVMGNVNAALLRNVSGATLSAVVRRAANIASVGTIIGISTPGPITRAQIAFRDPILTTNQGLCAGGRRTNSNNYQSVGAAPYNPEWIIVIAVFNYTAATLTLFENGTQTATRVFQTSGVTPNDAGGLFIGANAVGNGAFLNGDVAEIGIMHFAAGPTLRQQIEGYLAGTVAGWDLQANLPGDHPFRFAPPVIS